MSTLSARAFTWSPVYLAMTVTVDGRQIAIGVVLVVLILVMDLHQRLRQEEEPTVSATACLSFQPGGHPAWYARVAPPTCGPVPPVPIERTGHVPHFGVPDNGHVAVLIERQPVVGGKHPPVPLVRAPVALDDPVARLAGVSVARPSCEFYVQLVVQALEDGLADHGAVVIAPACNHWVQQPDQIGLPGGFVMRGDRRELGVMTLDGVLPRSDERFEAACRVVPTHGVLADLEPEEVEARLPPLGFQGMDDAGLLSVQFEPHALQPLFRQALTVLDDGFVPVEHHEVIRIPDNLGFPAHLDAFARLLTAGFGGELGAEMRFEAVQGDIGQHGAEDRPLGRPRLRLGEDSLVQHARLQPAAEQPVEMRGRLRLA